MFGGLVSKDSEVVDAIAGASAIGIVSFNTLRGIMSAKWSKEGTSLAQKIEGSWVGKRVPGGAGVWDTGVPALIGAGLAWYWYTSNYEKDKTIKEVVSFQCLPWQAPRGGEDCELCNDGNLPCSEYRCKSLGQSCAIINKGTKFESCVNQNPRDTNPPVIKPWKEKLTPGYEYTDIKLSPPGPGFKIKRTEGTNVCIKAFTPIEFGVQTDEPAQCKIDVEYKENFDQMTTFMGGDNLYSYNHSEYLALPKAKDIKNSTIKLEMGDEMTLYLRCRDSLGNVNSAAYAVRFCVDSAPDSTPPVIKATSIESQSCVAAGRNSTSVDFYTDEPARCKWSFDDQAYGSMPNNMSCTTQVYQVNSMMLYTCRAELTGIKREGTNYFVRCEDLQGEPEKDRNRNEQSFSFSLRGSNPLKLKTILPNGTLYGGVSPMRVELKAESLFGCNNNRAVCFYSPTGEANSYVMFFDTDKTDGIHKQMLDLYSGQHTYFVKCVDAGGNVAENSTRFELDIDTTSPIITRAYFEDDYLKVVTARNSDCVYSTASCDFLFEEGITMPYAKSTTHVVSWESDKIHYVKCRDEFRNEPIDCSMVIRPKENFLYF
jgi:hypothetical protein